MLHYTCHIFYLKKGPGECLPNGMGKHEVVGAPKKNMFVEKAIFSFRAFKSSALILLPPCNASDNQFQPPPQPQADSRLQSINAKLLLPGVWQWHGADHGLRDASNHGKSVSYYCTTEPLICYFFLERELGSPKSKIMRTRCKMDWPHNKVGPCLIPGRHFPTPTNTNWKDKILMNPFCFYKSSVVCLTLVFFCNFGIHILLSLTSYRHIGRFSPTLVARLLNSPYIYGAKTSIPKQDPRSTKANEETIIDSCNIMICFESIK